MAACFPVRPNIVILEGANRVSITPAKKFSIVQTQLLCYDEVKFKRSSLTIYRNYPTMERKFEGSFAKISNIRADIFIKRQKLPATCKEFARYEDMAYSLVDDILEEAAQVLEIRYNLDVEDHTRRQSRAKNIMWPTAANFNTKIAAEKLREYIDFTSDVQENWLYVLNLVAELSNTVSDFYLYEAKFSIPTRCYPVPQATASVFFNFEVSRVVPAHCPVRVTYTLEGCRTVFEPGQTVITDNLLFRVMYSKLSVFQKLEW